MIIEIQLTNKHLSLSIYIYMNLYRYACIYVYMYRCIYVYAHMHLYTCSIVCCIVLYHTILTMI